MSAGKITISTREAAWDKLLKIKTTGRDDSHADSYNYPYEPMPYCVLERLANRALITAKDAVLDYGSGKGRVSFYLSYQTKARTIGVEYDEYISHLMAVDELEFFDEIDCSDLFEGNDSRERIMILGMQYLNAA